MNPERQKSIRAIAEGRQAVIISAAFVLAIFDASPLAPGDVRASVLVGAIILAASCKAIGHVIVDLPSLPAPAPGVRRK